MATGCLVVWLATKSLQVLNRLTSGSRAAAAMAFRLAPTVKAIKLHLGLIIPAAALLILIFCNSFGLPGAESAVLWTSTFSAKLNRLSDW